MTPERKHELNKLMAEVVGKTVREDYVEVHGPNGVTKELAWVDENQFLWDPVDDANDSEVVEASLKKDCEITYMWNLLREWWFAEIRVRSQLKIYSDNDPCKRVAFALAVEQWWEAKKGQT